MQHELGTDYSYMLYVSAGIPLLTITNSVVFKEIPPGRKLKIFMMIKYCSLVRWVGCSVAVLQCYSVAVWF